MTGKRSPVDAREAAVALFNSGYNCSESIVLAHAPEAAPAAQRAGTALGGGIARHGFVCGCITGCAVAVGLRLGRRDPGDNASKELCYRIVGRVVDRFERAFGTVECRKLTGLDFTTEHPQEELDRVHTEVCARLVRFAADAALAALAEAGAEGR